MQTINNNLKNLNLESKNFIVLLKSNNQSSFPVAYNLVFYVKTKDINMQYHYICDKVAAKKIELIYISTDKVIANGLTKLLIHARFYIFVSQI